VTALSVQAVDDAAVLTVELFAWTAELARHEGLHARVPPLDSESLQANIEPVDPDSPWRFQLEPMTSLVNSELRGCEREFAFRTLVGDEDRSQALLGSASHECPVGPLRLSALPT
jgi:hypothetical protein